MSASDRPIPDPTSTSAASAGAVVDAPAPVLEVADLRVATARQTLLHDVGFRLGAGERLGIIGESGSGKSLTVLSAMGLLPDGLDATGTIRLDGVDGNLLDASEKRLAGLRGQRMSMVFQEPMTALNPLMRVGHQVGETMLLHGTQRGKKAAGAAAVEMLDRVRLPDPAAAARAYPHQLSGGQRQRVMLAMALANDPSVLICDEPTTALDVTVQEQMLELIREGVAARESALLFITHDLAVVASICSRVLVLNDGRIVESGMVDKVFTAPDHEYTRALLAASDLEASGRTARLRGAATSAVRAEADATAEAAAGTGVAAGKPAPLASPAPSASSTAADDEQATEDAGPLIRVRGVTREYHRSRTSLRQASAGIKALQGVDLDIHAGQRFGIVGESGSGKSTLIRLIAGLDQPTAGSISFAGTEIAGQKERQLGFLRRELQVVFQDPMGSLNPRMRVRDIVAEPLVAQGVPEPERRARVDELLEAVRLPPDAASRFPHQFSGGQRQRISIARALSVKPRVLVADEAVSALDVSVRAQILDLITDLVEQYGLTLIFISHDLSVIRHVCDTVAVMRNGSVVETGPTEAVYGNPQEEYTQRLLAAAPTLERVLATQATTRSAEEAVER